MFNDKFVIGGSYRLDSAVSAISWFSILKFLVFGIWI